MRNFKNVVGYLIAGAVFAGIAPAQTSEMGESRHPGESARYQIVLSGHGAELAQGVNAYLVRNDPTPPADQAGFKTQLTGAGNKERPGVFIVDCPIPEGAATGEYRLILDVIFPTGVLRYEHEELRVPLVRVKNDRTFRKPEIKVAPLPSHD